MSLFLDRFLKITSILTPIFLIYYIFNQDYSSAREIYKEWYALIGLTLFNTTHIFITPLKLIYIPEFKSLSLFRNKSFYMRCLGLVIGGYVLYYIGIVCNSSIGASNFILRLIVYATSVHHSLMQTFGLSSRLHYISNPVRKVEKHSVIALFIISLTVFGVTRTRYEIYVPTATLFIFIAWLIFSIKIYKNTSSEHKNEKIFFLFRYLAFALCFINPIFTLITMNFHGVEYLKTYFDIGAKSQLPHSIFLRSTCILFILVPLTALLLHFDYVIDLVNISFSVATINFIKSTLIGLNFLHYYADARIYRMQDLEVRKNIAPLLSLTKV